MFTPRLEKPESKNPYYNTIANGGYSRAIVGKPTDSGCNVLSNCVGYAYGRFHEIAECKEMNLYDPVNAENTLANAQQHGLKTGNTPKLGAVLVMQKGATLSGSDGAGHVAVVEQINPDGSIITSESGYNAKSPFWLTTRRGANWGCNAPYKFLGFVYQPEKVPSGSIRLGDHGDSVKWLQEKLYQRGYMRKTEVDGDFGKITLGGLLAFQMENGLEVDGVCGTKTKAKLTE